MRWHLYFAHGRNQLRIGVWREHPQSSRFWPSREYRFVAFEWQI